MAAPVVCVELLQQEGLEREHRSSHGTQETDATAELCSAGWSQWRASWEAGRSSGVEGPGQWHCMALFLSGPRFVDTSALIRLPDDCTVGYIIECKLGGHLQPSPLFHSHLETLQLLGAAQLPKQVSQPWAGGSGGGVCVRAMPY